MQGYRLVSWWIKWEDLNWPNQDTLDRIRRRADQVAAANANAAIVFGTHFRWDWLPFFEILHDYLATVASELHSRGIKFFDHHSVNLVHRYDTREEMRHTILHSGPHLPFSPSRSAAKDWEFHGRKLNDWRMIDILTGKPRYFPGYSAEGFCHRNLEFISAHMEYVRKLIADTGIDGLMSDDTVYYGGYSACGCRYCRTEFKARTGLELPDPSDTAFWGNWRNPAWKAWIDLRFDAAALFHKNLHTVMPEGFMHASCCPGSTVANSNNIACDARHFLEGTNYQHLEMVGNTPPYKHDSGTVNYPIAHHFINAAHHSAAAKEAHARCYGNGYGFCEATANIVWAVNKCLGSDCWFSTLKGRLGLPDSILATLPDDASPAGRAFTFEAEHPELFDSEPIHQFGVYFSYETRNHTCFGNLVNGYSKDFTATMTRFFNSGLSAAAVLTMPEDTREFKLLVLPSALKLTDDELRKLRRFTAAGGTVLATGPCGIPGAESSWQLPDSAGEKFWNGVSAITGWKSTGENWARQEIPVPDLSQAQWREIEPGVFQHPARLGDGVIDESLLELVHKYLSPLPVELRGADGYLSIVRRNASGYIVHLLAADYDTDIDHHLDEIRFHRSRINLITKVEAVNTSPRIELATELAAEVFTPFDDAGAQLERTPGKVVVTPPARCAYLIVRLSGK